MRRGGGSLPLLIEKALKKLKEYKIDIENREAAYQCFDRCCFPKILKGAYEVARATRSPCIKRIKRIKGVR